MVHLQSAVAGPAQQIISGMFYEGRLYEDALRALEDRFGKKEDIVQENMKAIFRSPSPSSNQDLQGLERFHSAVHSAVTVLQNLEYDGDLHSTENLRRVIEKLPQDMKYAWSEHAVEMEPRRASLTEFDQWLAKQQVEEWWTTEAFGTRCDVNESSAEDQRSIKILNDTVKRGENRYESGLLWKNEDVKMPENQATAMGRLKKLEKSLMRDPKKAEAYGAAIRADAACYTQTALVEAAGPQGTCRLRILLDGGSDSSWLVHPDVGGRCTRPGLAVDTVFGYVIHGREELPVTSTSVRYALRCSRRLPEEEAEQLWRLEAIGISEDEARPQAYPTWSLEDQRSDCDRTNAEKQ
ncbi:hypothetical protein FJT64_013392 [Amphibalanus amphitrite]|uniref:Peptidase aspartic putative domain-containing protein n=1 Tax=Amphibalanus amphitrite TaxID=1232801 RepID=A0A6A4VFI4_AMPAM|nr:hypothetical protein FJT64_013392 [Amphibalanus amphitrite]